MPICREPVAAVAWDNNSLAGFWLGLHALPDPAAGQSMPRGIRSVSIETG